jgi:predicted CXXCH cytochrome family protein
MKKTFLSFIILFVFSLKVHAVEEKSLLSILPRVNNLKSFPCTKCHQNFKKNETEWPKPQNHPNISLHHMPEVGRCLLCHSSRSPNQLNLKDGTLVTIDQVPQLCGQCHGKIFVRWSQGLHGKEVGTWNANKIRWTCSECHDPHSPKFKPMEAVANPPMSPYVIPKEKSHE